MSTHEQERQREAGFAIAFSLLMIMILTLLGGSLLLVAATENRIAENERLSAQALYAAETGVKVAKRWFDRPGAASNAGNPELDAIDRTLRLIDDGVPSTPVVAAVGSGGAPYYKQDIDVDGDGADDVFDQPFRGSLEDTLLGTEEGPDMRIAEDASTEASDFLRELSATLFADYPGRGHEARISSIDIYGPPHAEVGGVWERFGMGTIKVVARIYEVTEDGTEMPIAERMVKVVINEIPYNPGGLGPLHSCDTLTWNGEFSVHWGTSTAVSTTDLHNNHDKLAVSWPRVEVGGDLEMWGYDNAANFAAYKSVIDGLRVQDPWLEVVFGGPLLDAPSSDPQPWPFTWTSGPLANGQIPYHPGPPGPHPYPTTWDGTHSNVLQNAPNLNCPEMPYELWKSIATAGGPDVHYYTWDSGTAFRENGVGPATDFRDITDGQTGLYFFDTMDGLAPHDDDGDGEHDNLTPEITVQGGTWGVRGVVYLNALQFGTHGLQGRDVTFNAPGEPFQDADLDGTWDAGEDWLNLDYPTTLAGSFKADSSDQHQDPDWSNGSTVVRNARGPSIDAEALVWGILYTNGYYDATGNGTYYGTVISKLGIGWLSPSSGTPDHYFDESLRENWPPDSWGLPRVTVTRWETDK